MSSSLGYAVVEATTTMSHLFTVGSYVNVAPNTSPGCNSHGGAAFVHGVNRKISPPGGRTDGKECRSPAYLWWHQINVLEEADAARTEWIGEQQGKNPLLVILGCAFFKESRSWHKKCGFLPL